VSSGDRILITYPTFAMYPVYTAMFNAEFVTVEYNQDMTFPTEKFLDRIYPGIKLAIVVNPNNPTGSVLTKGELIEIIKKAASNDVLVIVDEAYFHYYPETMIPYIKSYNNLAVLRTFSKLCGIAAARLGYVAASPYIIEGIKKVRPTFDVNAIAVLFAEKVLDSPQIIQDLIKDASEGKKYLVEKLREKNIVCKEGHANFVLVKCNGRVNEVMAGLKEKGILVGGEFKQEYLNDYIRVTIARKDYMDKFWEAFAAIWDA
jgi:histidinol-phosphate aminotransferase